MKGKKRKSVILANTKWGLTPFGRKGVRPLQVFVLLFVVYSLVRLPVAFAAPLLVDDFEGATNKLGGRSNVYVSEPSRALAVRSKENPHDGTGVLMIKYDKKAKGGPYDSGGWCGYYTSLKSGPRYFDATGYQTITFWVRGATGSENFVVGLSDHHWDEVGDSVKSEAIGKYLPGGKLTTEWQKATVPLATFMLDMKELASIAICFEGSLFPDGAGQGTVYIDDVVLE